MKYILISLLFVAEVLAVDLKFIGPCEEDFVMKTQVTDEFQNVGELTLSTLRKFNIPFQGSPEQIFSVFETPTGDAAIEIVSKDEYRVYGWCFTVDGEAPELFPHEVPVHDVKEIVWTFGFARSLHGQWVEQCSPAWKVKPAKLCLDTHEIPSTILRN